MKALKICIVKKENKIQINSIEITINKPSIYEEKTDIRNELIAIIMKFID